MHKFLLLLLSVLVFAAPPKEAPPVSIIVSEVKSIPEVETISYPGTLKANQSAKLALERSGVVSKVLQNEFSFVEEGQVILKINSDVLSAQLSSAAAQLKLANIEYERVKKLFLTNVISASVFDKIKSDLQIAKANYDMLAAQLEQTILRAPFSGYIDEISKEVGEFVNAGSLLTTINAVGAYHVEFYLPQDKISQINKLTKVTILLDDKIYLANKIIKSNSVDESTKLVKIEANFVAKHLSPGAFARVNVTFSQGKKTIVVPESAVLYDSEGIYVYKMESNKPVKTKVLLGAANNGDIAILKGLKKGDVIVSVGQFKLYPNAPIVIVK